MCCLLPRKKDTGARTAASLKPMEENGVEDGWKQWCNVDPRRAIAIINQQCLCNYRRVAPNPFSLVRCSQVCQLSLTPHSIIIILSKTLS
jgi:hypothetical protein